MKTKITFLLSVIFTSFFTQTIKTDILAQGSSNFQILKITQNSPDSRVDSETVNFTLTRQDQLHIFRITKSRSNAIVPVFEEELLKSIEVGFDFSKEPMISEENFSEIYRQIKKYNDKRFGKDTIGFGDYYFMMCHPTLFLDSYFYPNIDLLKPFHKASIKGDSRKVVLNGPIDSLIADYTLNLSSKGTLATIIQTYKSDSVATKEYLFKKKVKKEGDKIKEFLSEKDMIYSRQLISINSTFNKHENGVYILNTMAWERIRNYGNSFDRIERLKITKL